MDKLFMRWMPIALAVLFLAGCQFWNVKRHVTIGEMIYTVDMREEDHVKFDDGKVKFEVYGEEMIEKKVKMSGNSGRVYLPPGWIGHQVKIIRIN